MSLIAIEASIRLNDPAVRDAAVADSVKYQQATRDEEPGCIVYCFAADPCEPDHIQVYELWADEETLAAHFDHPNYHNMRELLGKYGLKSAVSRKHRIDATAPVYGPDFKASAKFS
jgi:quinol monooxygenase YgiN